jgi:hypothetical protein
LSENQYEPKFMAMARPNAIIAPCCPPMRLPMPMKAANSTTISTPTFKVFIIVSMLPRGANKKPPSHTATKALSAFTALSDEGLRFRRAPLRFSTRRIDDARSAASCATALSPSFL